MPDISVIVPVYKAEKYIESCVQSILAQTYSDFELILVEDGSPDRSGEICDALAETDTRIRVIHKENGGAASARNAGLDAALYGYYQNPNSIMGSKWNPRHLHELIAMEEQCDFLEERGYLRLFQKRARDLVKLAAQTLERINSMENPMSYQNETTWVKNKGTQILKRCKRKNVFNLERDGWLIKSFYPTKVRIYSLFVAARNKVARKTGK